MKKKKSRTSRRPSTKPIKRCLMSFMFVFISSIAFWIQEQQHEIRTPDSNTPIELYANQIDDNLSGTFAAAIDEAKNSILLVIYSLTDDRIIECLRNQSQNGVNVKVICDAKASHQVYARLGDKVDLIRRFGPGLMHQKILVVDEEKVWLGSANMTSESLGMHGNLVTAMHSSSLADKILRKAETLKEEGTSLPSLQEDFMVGGQKIEMWFLPDNKKAVDRLKTLIQNAKKTIRVAMFAWTRQDLAQSVVEAAQRGVKTEVVIDNHLGKGAGAKIVKYLKDNKINVALNTGAPLLHHKFLYIDGKTLVHGSANWTKAAFTQNDDCFIVMHNLTKQQHKQMENLWKVIKKESCPP